MGFPSIHKFDHKIAVYYKFMGATDYTRITIDGPPVSVGFLIAMILEFNYLGTCEEIDFAVSDAETNEEYQDESMLLENNTYVVIRLVSRSPPITATTAQEPIIENKVENVHVADLSGEAFELSERRFFPNMQDDYETYSEFPKFDTNLQSGSVQRRLDFEVPQMLKNDIVGDQQTACDNKVVSSWRCVVPSNSLHLNASTTPIYSQESIRETVIEEAPQAVKVNPGSVKKKMYCECFAAGYYCLNSADPCLCVDCFNKPSHEGTVAAVRKEIEKRNPLAFSPKVIPSTDSVMEGIYDASKTPPSARHKRGCNCKKSNSLQNYCECLKGSVGCSSQCKCKACMNTYGARNEG